MELKRRFGGHVRQLRTARSITQDNLAERSGLSVDTVRRIESGSISPSLDTMSKLANGLNVSVATLFQGLDGGRRNEVSELCDYLSDKPAAQVRLAFEVLRQLFEPG